MTASTAATSVSVAPDGIEYAIPSAAKARADLERIVAAAEAFGGSVVVVQGLGFVGAAVCGALAASGRHLVVGVDLPRPESYWKVAKLGSGSVFGSPDPELAAAIAEGVAAGRLFTTTLDEAYALADVIVVDVDLGLDGRAEVALEPFERAIRAAGAHMRDDALLIVETTVPPGTCRTIVLPALEEERRRRGIESAPLLANAYERVMPGAHYLASVRAYPRSYAGLDPVSARGARQFLESFVDAPLRELPDLESAELGKLLENSYRAANIAFIHEWTRLAESIGVDLWSVVDSIRARVGTHDNIRNPGVGVGGYCLTKDSFLAQWGAERLLGSDVRLETTLAALEINALMPLHTFEHARVLAGGELRGRRIALCGVAYLPDVADTRNSPTELLWRELRAAGAEVRVHDPQVVRWAEQPEAIVEQDLARALAGVDGVVLAVRHSGYREVDAERLAELVGAPGWVVDAQNMLGDEDAQRLHAAGWRVSGVGKGHWRAAGYGASA
jgi:UDP-N-acetyl-D-glucosamine dehydrogenase